VDEVIKVFDHLNLALDENFTNQQAGIFTAVQKVIPLSLDVP
jgi:hypothetical protein